MKYYCFIQKVLLGCDRKKTPIATLKFFERSDYYLYRWLLLTFFMLIVIMPIFSISSATVATRSYLLQHDYYELPLIKVHESQENSFATPVAWYGDSIYVVNVEPPDGANTGINLKTVIRQYSIDSTGNWIVESNVIEDRTMDDRFHTQPSIGIDKNGYIHVVYNMHNMPWQYKVSKNPGDISEFVFKGEHLTEEQISTVKHQNKTPFYNLGIAAIPENQITYPSFFKDRNNDLYITYRFAPRPKRPWNERGFAGGIAKYNIQKKEWEPLGGSMSITTADADYPEGVEKPYMVYPFGYTEDTVKWSIALIRLHFDINNDMHVSWTWREDGSGPDYSHPSYAFRSRTDGLFKNADRSAPYSLPISVKDIDLVSTGMTVENFGSATSIATDINQQPHIILSPLGSSRVLLYHDKTKNEWSEPQLTPWGASEIFIDDSGKHWAFSSGVNIFNRNDSKSPWTRILNDKTGSGYGWQKIFFVKELNGFLIHSMSMDKANVKVIWVRAGNAPPVTPQNLRIASLN